MGLVGSFLPCIMDLLNFFLIFFSFTTPPPPPSPAPRQNSKFSEVCEKKHFNAVMRFYPFRILEEKKRKVLSVLTHKKDSNDQFSTSDVTSES